MPKEFVGGLAVAEKLTGLQKAQLKVQAMRDAGIPLVQLNPIEKHLRNPNSLRFAIRAKCYDCVGQAGDANWRGRVGNCPVTKCPLHTVRPFQTKDASDDE